MFNLPLLELRRFRRLNRIAPESNEIEDLSLIAPQRRLHQSKAAEMGFRLMLRVFPRINVDLRRYLLPNGLPRSPWSEVEGERK